MDLIPAIQAFFDSPAGQAAIGVLVVAIVDLVLGIAAAIRDSTFQLDAVAAWLRRHIAGRVLPIWVLLFVGHFTQGIAFSDVPVLLSIGLASAGLYVVETVGSILKAWGPAASAGQTPGLINRDPVQPVPQD